SPPRPRGMKPGVRSPGETSDKQAAQNLITESQQLWDAGKHKEAAEKALEGLGIAREIARIDPSYRRQLAEWLAYPSSNFLASAGRFEEAIRVGDESIALYKQLSAENPGDDELVRRMAGAAMNLAQSLGISREMMPSAADYAMKGLDILRPLAARNPAYRRQLADWALWPTPNFLASAGRFDDAIKIGDEAIRLSAQLSAENPNDDELRYQSARANLNTGVAIGLKQEMMPRAAEYAVKGLDILRPLAARNPAYRRQLADWALWPTPNFLASAGRFDEAIKVGDEAIGLSAQLSAENPNDDELRYQSARANLNTGVAIGLKQEMMPKAAEYAVKGLDILRPLAARNPAYRPQLGEWIMYPAIDFQLSVGRKPEAVHLAQEAVNIFTVLNQTDPATYGPKLAAAKKRLDELQH
ncbi:tetratricopeptide repeat protein, partial [Amycolatopsis albidoflavus]